MQSTLLIGSDPRHKDSVGIARKMLARIANTIANIGCSRHGIGKRKAAFIFRHLVMGMPEVQIKFTEIIESAVAAGLTGIVNAGIGKTVFRYLHSFRHRSAEYIHAHIAVADRQGPLFPTVIGHALSVSEHRKVLMSVRCFFRIP